jgi:hypothetical protein
MLTARNLNGGWLVRMRAYRGHEKHRLAAGSRAVDSRTRKKCENSKVLTMCTNFTKAGLF